MPFYSFDPHEEDGDWESDLLDDNMPVSGKRIVSIQLIHKMI
jgi:hypothetical protein